MAKEDGTNNDLIDDDDLIDEENPGGAQATEETGKGGEPPATVGDQENGDFIVELPDETEQLADDIVNGQETDEELAAKREARRQERQERKARQREQQERLRRELQEARENNRRLEERLNIIERRSSGAELAQLETVAKQTKQAYDHFKDQIRLGQEKGDGVMVADATEKMILAQQRLTQLENIKNTMQRKQNAPAPLDDRMVSQADAFMKKHNWYKPDGQDEDSMILRALDNKVASEGWDPTSATYWQELESRVQKYLPHRTKSAKVSKPDPDDDEGTDSRPKQQAKPKSTVAGSGRDSQASAGTKSTFRLSAARVAALKEAGMWDDPKARTEAIKRFRDYDKQQQQKGN